jgi:peptide/nickel transport system ATP-binding protein
MGARLIDIQQLSIGFRQRGNYQPAVRDVSFHIDRGEIIGLVGESGSGKSVTSLSMMQLLPPPPTTRIQGKIHYYEEGSSTDLLRLSPEAIRHYRGNHLGMIFQEPMSSLNPVYTCGNQITEAIRVHHTVSREEAAAQAVRLFEQVQLPDPAQMMHRYPHQLSGGQKQRVMIAMAVCCQPSLVIADEPTTALDVTVQQAILQLLRQLQQQLQISVLFITHDLGVVAEIADRVLVMYKGQLVEEGTTEQVFSSPRHPYTKGLIACRPPLHRKLRRLPVVADFMEEKAGEIQEKSTDLAGLLEQLEEPAEAVQARLTALASQEPVLDVRNLSVRFPTRKSALGKVQSWTYAVDGVSFALHPGETLGLVGESGCGKTTLSRAVLQLIRPAAGQVLYQGTDLCQVRDKTLRRLRKQIQIIFQDPYSSLNPRMTVGQAIMEPMQVHGLYGNDAQRRRKTIELLEKVTLNAAHFHRYPHEFSGGQRQRIGIARALALQPNLIICDESVSALDVSVQAQVLNLLLELKEEFHFSTIFISHDLSVVKFLCDRILVMRQGRIEEAGPAEQIYRHPASDYTRQLLEAIPHGPEQSESKT